MSGFECSFLIPFMLGIAAGCVITCIAVHMYLDATGAYSDR